VCEALALLLALVFFSVRLKGAPRPRGLSFGNWLAGRPGYESWLKSLWLCYTFHVRLVLSYTITQKSERPNLHFGRSCVRLSTNGKAPMLSATTTESIKGSYFDHRTAGAWRKLNLVGGR
jgi:hypothetical protein